MSDYRGVKLKSIAEPESASLVNGASFDDDGDDIETIDGTERNNGARKYRLDLSEMDTIDTVRVSPELIQSSPRKALSVRDLDVQLYAKNGDKVGFEEEVRNAQYDRAVIARCLNKETDDLPPLHYAVRHGHIDMIKAFLQYGADVDIRNQERQTPLHLAAKYRPAALTAYAKPACSPAVMRRASPAVGKRPMMRTLRSFGASVPKPKIPETIISVLLANNADVNARDKFDYTPLHYAAVKDNKFEAQQLLDVHNVDVNAVDLHNSTPLHQAASHGATDVAQLLLANKARIHDIDDKRNTPLHLACRNGQEGIVKLLLDSISDPAERQRYIEQSNYEDNNALHYAAQGDHLDVVNEIFNANVDINVNVTRKDKMSLLHLAAQKGSEDLCRKLIEMGANVSAVDTNKRTPLDYAAFHNRDEIICLLLSEGADIECRTKDGFTPFLTAVSENNLDAVKKLVECDCDRTVVDVEQRSAIYLAAKFNGINILKYLLEDSEDDYYFISDYVNKQASDFQTPMHLAAANMYIDVLTLLKEKGALITAAGDDEETPLHLAAQQNHVEVVDLLLDWDDNQIDDGDENGNTPLHYAAKEGNIEVVMLLIERGADVVAKNERELTPLDCAVQGGHRECVEALIEARTPIEPPQNKVTTALHIAAEQGHDELIPLLIDQDITIDRLNEHDKTALDIAISKNYSNVAKGILQSSDWRNVLRVSKGSKETHKHKHKIPCTAMCQLIRDMPDIAKIVFDKCMNPTKDEYGHNVIEMDYEFINDSYIMKTMGESEGKTADKYPYDMNGKLKKDAELKDQNYDNVIQSHPLQIMVESERIDLLKHKLVASLIRHKWNTYARYVYYTALFIYILFLASFSIYVTNTPPPYEVIDINRTWEATGTLDQKECERISDRRPFFLDFFRKVAMMLAIGQIVKEVYQLINRWWRYFNTENCFEVCLYTGAFLVCVDLNPCASATGIRSPWQWMLAGVVIFCAWINLILLIRKIPRFGIYVVMVVNTIKTFYRFSLIFALFVIAFSSGFFVVLQNKPEFSSYLPSFVKTTVMMIGEFEYTAIFYEVEEQDKHASHLFGRPIAHGIFMVFMVVMNVILMNLLVGLAVDDIKGVLERAELMRLRMQVETILDIERALPDWFRRHAHRGKEILYVERKKPRFDKSFFSNCWRYMGYSRSDIEELQEEYDDMETANLVINNQNRNMRAIEATAKAVREVSDSMRYADVRIDKLQEKTAVIEKLLVQLLEMQTGGGDSKNSEGRRSSTRSLQGK